MFFTRSFGSNGMFVSVATSGPPGILRFPIDFIFHDLSQAFGRSSEPAAFVTAEKQKQTCACTEDKSPPGAQPLSQKQGKWTKCGVHGVLMGMLFGDLSTAAPVTLICRASLCFSCFAGVFCGVFFSQCSSRPAVHLTPSRCRTSVNRLFYSSANSLSLNEMITLNLQPNTLL